MQSTYVAASSFNDKVSAESLKDLYKLSETDLKNVRAFSKQMAPKSKTMWMNFMFGLRPSQSTYSIFLIRKNLKSVIY